MMRVWAAATGLILIAWFVVQMVSGQSVSEMLPMLIAAILGFELTLLGQDAWRKREQRRG